MRSVSEPMVISAVLPACGTKADALAADHDGAAH
jgi:hypothetical protein